MTCEARLTGFEVCLFRPYHPYHPHLPILRLCRDVFALFFLLILCPDAWPIIASHPQGGRHGADKPLCVLSSAFALPPGVPTPAPARGDCPAQRRAHTREVRTDLQKCTPQFLGFAALARSLGHLRWNACKLSPKLQIWWYLDVRFQFAQGHAVDFLKLLEEKVLGLASVLGVCSGACARGVRLLTNRNASCSLLPSCTSLSPLHRRLSENLKSSMGTCGGRRQHTTSDGSNPIGAPHADFFPPLAAARA